VILLEQYANREAINQHFVMPHTQAFIERALRMVLKIADLWKMKPEGYKQLAESTCMRPGA
jgi:quinol monooxygenase YgiN